MESRLGRPCLFLPSGRLALYLALKTWLKPANRVLMSPVTDDVIFFTVLAAGLRPVMAPLSPEDGNIEPSLVPDDVRAHRAEHGADIAGCETLVNPPDQGDILLRHDLSPFWPSGATMVQPWPFASGADRWRA